jgi:hypothetical protein
MVPKLKSTTFAMMTSNIVKLMQLGVPNPEDIRVIISLDY